MLGQYGENCILWQTRFRYFWQKVQNLPKIRYNIGVMLAQSRRKNGGLIRNKNPEKTRKCADNKKSNRKRLEIQSIFGERVVNN